MVEARAAEGTGENGHGHAGMIEWGCPFSVGRRTVRDDPRGRWGSAGRMAGRNQTPARGNTNGGISASDADGTTRTTKRGKIVKNRLHIGVYVGYNRVTLRRFRPPICPPGKTPAVVWAVELGVRR